MDTYRPTRFTLLKRRQDITHEEFNEHWHTGHGSLLASLADFNRCNHSYVQNHLLPTPDSLNSRRTQDNIWDGIAQTFQRVYKNDFLDFFDTPGFIAVVRPDEELFLDFPASTTTYCTQRVIKDGPAQGVKYLAFLRPAQGLDQTAFSEYWFHKHVSVVKKSDEFWGRVRRYCQYHTRPELFRGSSQMDKSEAFSGVSEIYFDSIADLEAAFTHSDYTSAIYPDALNFMAGSSQFFIAQELPILINGEPSSIS